MAQPNSSQENVGTIENQDVILEIRHLTKHFPIGNALRLKHVHALNDASFTISRGEVVALVGESGSGKSTTARLITRLIEPTRGEILLHGRNVLKTEPRRASLSYRKAVQMIFQDPFGSLNPVQPIGEQVELPIKLHKMARGRGVEERMLELLSTVGLNPPADVARRYPYELSG